MVLPTIIAKPEIDYDAWGADGLTIRQRMFVKALVGPAGGNATKAAEMAGYASENINALRVTASENLGKPNVQRALAHAMAEKFGSAEWARTALLDLAGSSMANFLGVDEQGKMKLDLNSARAQGALGQIKEMTLDENGVPVKIKIHDRTKAIELLLKLHGLIVGQHEHAPTAPAIEGDLPDEELLDMYLVCKLPRERWLPGVRQRFEQGAIQPRKAVASTVTPA